MATKTPKGHRGVGMEGAIARWYTSSVRRNEAAFREQVELVRKYGPERGDVLEVAPGPGFLAIELVRTGDYRVTGLDISTTFVDIAVANATAAGVDVAFRQGDAAHLPFDDESFDLVVCCAAFKNFTDPVGALREMRRVLRPSGVAIVFDLRRDVQKSDVDDEVERLGVHGLSKVVTKVTLGHWLPRRAYGKEQFERMVGDAGFVDFEVNETRMSWEVVMSKGCTPPHS